MWKVFSLLLGLLTIQVCCGAFPSVYKKIIQRPNENTDDPLILTPLIKENRIEEAQKASEVKSQVFLNERSYSGYFTVDDLFDSNLFFWYFPARENAETAPVILWLQGGPGGSSMFGLFTENGPFQFTDSGKMELRELTWNRHYHLLYIDNPVGTGFSFTNGGYAQNETKVGTDLYEGLVQFFTVFPELQDKEFYVSGESYAGKYIPAIAYTIHKKNPTAQLKINLKGIAIGNGLVYPYTQLTSYSELLYQLGLYDSNAKKKMQVYEQKIRNLVDQEKYTDGFKVVEEMMNGDEKGFSFFKNTTGYENFYNFLNPVDTSKSSEYMNDFLQTKEIKSAIHVGKQPFNDGDRVSDNLTDDILRPISDWLAELICNYRVMIYNGQLDILLAYRMTVEYLDKMKFCGKEEYKIAPRHKFMVEDEIAGYWKSAGNLTEVLVRNAGHMVPTDQPKWAWNLIDRFVSNQKL